MAAAIAAAYRTTLGGAGLVAALAGLLGVAAISMAFTPVLRRAGRALGARHLSALALPASVANLSSFFLLPPAIVGQVFQALALPMIITNVGCDSG